MLDYVLLQFVICVIHDVQLFNWVVINNTAVINWLIN